MCEMMSQDATDLAAAQAGSTEAFAGLYDRHAAVVLSLCRRNCAPEADDAVQETFLRAYRMLHQLDCPTAFRPWLYAIARRVCAERRRSARRRTHHEGRAVLMRIGEVAEHSTSFDSVHRAEQIDRLGSALETLPDSERLAIHLFYLEDDPVAVAAEALGLSRSGFYKLLARARAKLAARLREVPAL